MTPRDAVTALARDLGFAACGVAPLGPSERAAALREWLAAGRAGTMRYLHRQERKRARPAEIVPDASVAVVVLENYLPPGEEPPAGSGVRIARYARGTDYHQAMGARLDRLAEGLLALGATVARPYLDAGPVPERELAQRAGLGWVGKNTMLIRPGLGSWTFIGSVFTDLELPPDPPFELDRCGSCTRCLEACPTGAFPAPRVLDATRCLSYLTIEQKGPIPEAFGDLGGWAFGCDVCNEVCPWNERFARPTRHAEYAPRPDPDRADPEYFERLDDETFARRFGDTPLARPGLTGMRRNWRAARRTSRPDGA